MKRQVVSIRLTSTTAQWAKEYADQLGTDRTKLLEFLLEALQDRRLFLVSSPASNVINDGSCPEFPLSTT